MSRRCSVLFGATLITGFILLIVGCSSESGGGGGGGDELPDLMMTEFGTGVATTVEAGQPVCVHFTLKNDPEGGELPEMSGTRGMVTAPEAGTPEDAGPFKVKFYFSTDTAFDSTLDQAVTPELEMGGLDANVSNGISGFELNVPPGITPGDYSVFAVVDCYDEVKESDETNNIRWMSPGMFTVVAPQGSLPDLGFVWPSYDSELTVGESATINIRFTNTGRVATDTGCMVALYLSDDYFVDPGDVLIDGAAASLPPMATGESIYRDIDFTVPGDIIGGAYLLIQIDPEDAVTEVNEDNNICDLSVTISTD